MGSSSVAAPSTGASSCLNCGVQDYENQLLTAMQSGR